jgi:hypothetical protein
MAQDRDGWRAIPNTAVILRLPYDKDKLFTEPQKEAFVIKQYSAPRSLTQASDAACVGHVT